MNPNTPFASESRYDRIVGGFVNRMFALFIFLTRA